MTERKPFKLGKVTAIIIVLAGLLGWAGFHLADREGAIVSKQGNEVGGSYRLTDLGEGTVTEGDFHSRWVLMWFSDIHCPPEQCRPTYRAMSEAAEAFGVHRVAPLVVMLDPMRETADTRRAAVLPYGPRDIPLTGSPNEIAAVTQEFHAPDVKIPVGDRDYRMQPAPRIVIMDPDGHYAGMLEASATGQEIADRLRDLAKTR